MFSTLLERMSAPPRSAIPAEVLRASSDDSILSAITVDPTSNAQSSSSTPPTSIGDNASISSSSTKLDVTESTPADASEGRSKRVRTSVGTYNIKILAGTAIHAPKKYSKDPEVIEARRRRLLGETLVDALQTVVTTVDSHDDDTNTSANDGIEALDLQVSVKTVPKQRNRLSLGGTPKKSAKQRDLARRKSVKLPKTEIESISKRMSLLGKRDRKQFEDDLVGLSRAKRELKNLADTPEFAKIELKPVVHEVWSNGKLVTGEQPLKKKKKVEEESSPKSKGKAKEKEVELPVIEDEPEPPKSLVAKRKVYLNKGLYAGQETAALNWFRYDSVEYKNKMESIAPFSVKPRTFMPMPMWHGQRLLINGRDFKLPWDVCSPLPPGQPKPEEWKKTSTNRFVGEAKESWRPSKWKDSAASKCICTAARGCDEDCQNRIMLYECDDSNCGAGRARCTNRSFADLAERRKLGGKYRIGVEVVKTEDRGYGVRSNRCFDANQIIVEYTGEIITEAECDRRMNEVYKKNDCYYLMSFDQGMILDGTKGSIARFINHSCRPNCKMVKWYVAGKPRMALFAGDNPIMTGDELTYDYNFDPFSAKNVQECRCGSDNCRGVLGPKPKPKKAAEVIKEVIKAGVKRVKAGKRKLLQLYAGPESENEDKSVPSPKKRKIKEAKGAKAVKAAKATKALKAAKGVKGVRRSSSTVKPKKAKTGYIRGPYKKKDPSQLAKPRRKVSIKRSSVVIKKTIRKKTIKTYGKEQKKFFATSLGTPVDEDEPSSATPGHSSDSNTENSVRKNAAREMRGIRKGSRGPTPEATITLVNVFREDLVDEDDDMSGLSSLDSPVSPLSEYEEEEEDEY